MAVYYNECMRAPEDRPPEVPRSLEEEVRLREPSATELRQWVRLTRRCNNHCLFCLDTGAQDGGLVSSEEVRGLLEEGRARGATRLILSGGEPTLHPEFCDFVAEGNALGYDWIQTVTNGRMFAYKQFLKKALSAGLNEITFSMHAHEQELFDRLTGVPGAYDQSMAGLSNALEDRRCVVNVDIVINGLNVAHLKEILEFYIGLGVREFDLLQVVPFGRAFDPSAPSEGAMLYDVERAASALDRALELRNRADLVIWTNRLDPVFLEGHEVLIQDPYKLKDEVRGRQRELSAFASGEDIDCHHPERCTHCFLSRYCGHLEAVRDGLTRGDPVTLRLRGRDRDLDGELDLVSRWPVPVNGLWIEAVDIEAVAAVSDRLSAQRADNLVLDVEQYGDALETLLTTGELNGLTVSMVVLHSPEEATKALNVEAPKPRLAIHLDRRTADVVRGLAVSGNAGTSEPVVVIQQGRDLLSQVLELDVDPRDVFKPPAAGPITVQGLPRCLTGGAEAANAPTALDADLITTNRLLDPGRFVGFHIRNGYRVYSLRCRTCTLRSECRGLHINLARRFGLGMLRPIEGDK